jgi:hypothetical protein
MAQFLRCGFFLLFSVLLTARAEAAVPDDLTCENAPEVKISVTRSGLYRITGKELRDVFTCDALNFDRLRLSNQDKPDRFAIVNNRQTLSSELIFSARHLPGAQSYFNEFSPYNTYWLSLGEPAVEAVTPQLQGEHKHRPSAIHSFTRLEEDELRVRFPGRADAPQPEVWYWARLNSIDTAAFEVPLELQGRRATTVPAIRVGLRGWSTLPNGKYADVADHRIEVFLNDHLVGSGEWRDQQEFVLEILDVPPDILNKSESNRLSFRVPQRSLEGESKPMVDAVLLNWIEVDYDHNGILSVGQHNLRVHYQDGGWFRLSGLGDSPPFVMSEDGQQLKPFKSYQHGKVSWHQYTALKDTPAYVAVVGDAFYQATAIVADAPSNLRAVNQQADYLMLTHRSLRQAIEPLAGFHRQQGLSVQVIDIEDVYDEFNAGVLAPAAIRDFISYAYHNWQRPGPRFVLLVGDASWDVRSELGNDSNYADWTFKQREKSKFVKNTSYKYTDDMNAADRNLIPTWPVETYEGYAASDNVFVAVDGDDFLPDLAIGRFPVSDPADVTAIVDKTIAYHQQSEVGPWRRKVLWITNEERALQLTSDRLDDSFATTGFASTKIYPSSQEKDNVEHQAELQSAFNDGQLLVHFLGHGGRYVWRTGPPDFRKNHDLFTLEHLDQLTPTTRLPFVMSMTCYSAPFDHPTADSIGEKFLRMPDRGAIGVLAASWRNAPGLPFSQDVLNALSQPGTVGEAIMHAKQNHSDRLMIETYNLLGDPAARLALPRYKVELKTRKKRDYLKIRGRVVDMAFDGQVVVDWLDAQGNLIQSRQMVLKRGKFKLKVDQDPKREIARISAYAWNPQKNVDAMGGITLETQNETGKTNGQSTRPAAGHQNNP